MQLEGRSLRRDFFRFIIPSIVAQWVYAMYAMVDGLFVARGVSEIALSAVNIAVPFTTFLFAVALCFAVGSSTVIALYLGREELHKAKEVFTQNIITLAIVSLIITGVAYFKSSEIAVFLGAGPETIKNASTYIATIGVFSFFFVISYSLEVLIKTDGYPMKATIIVVLGCLLNGILDYIMVIVLHKGVWGAAFATGLSQLCVVLMYLTHFCGKDTHMRLVKHKFDGSLLLRTLRIGIASGITEFSAGIVIFLFNHYILKYLGEAYVASYTIVSYICTIAVMSMAGIIQGIQPLVSYHVGKDSMDKCRMLLKYALFTAEGIAVVLFALSYIGAGTISDLFISKEYSSLRNETIKAFHGFSWSYLLCGFNIIIGGYFTALERTKSAMAISLGRGFVFVAVSLQILTMIFQENGIWYAATLSEFMCFVLTFWLVRKNGLH